MKEIKLTRGKVAMVDDEDYELLSKWKWFATKDGYARRDLKVDGRTIAIPMHREILGIPPQKGLVSDHRNGDRLDNRRSNLRWATVAQNAYNKKTQSDNRLGIKGVCFVRDVKRNHPYRGLIYIKGKSVIIGYFSTPEEAKTARDQAAKRIHGEFFRAA
jgi:hypothetical protein